MGSSASPGGLSTRKSVLLVGGCHGTCLVLNSDDQEGAMARRQFLLANAVVLAISLTIVALVVAFAWS